MWEVGTEYAFPKFHHAAPARINRASDGATEQAGGQACSSLTFHVLFHSIARVRSSRVRASLSLPLPLPLKGRGCDARDVAGSRLPFVRPHLALSLFPCPLSRPRPLACSLPFPIQSSEAFPDGPRYAPEIFSANVSRLSLSVLPTFLEFRKPVSCSEFLPPESKQAKSEVGSEK